MCRRNDMEYALGNKRRKMINNKSLATARLLCYCIRKGHYFIEFLFYLRDADGVPLQT